VKFSAKKSMTVGVMLTTAPLLLSACGQAPTSATNPAAATSAAVAGFKPCMVSDSGGFDDKSFNQLGYEGLVAAASQLGVKPVAVRSNAVTDFAPNLTNLVSQKCSLIVSVGYSLADATIASAKANSSVNYVSIDDTLDADHDGKTDIPNAKPIIFDTSQAAFLAGYAAAAYSKTKVVGTFGGMNLPTVSIFMDGFKQGVEYYNTKKGTTVKVVGWNGKDGSFTGGFEANLAAQNTAQSLIDQNVDVLLPVGGPIYKSAAAAIRAAGRSIALIGVDADITKTDPSVADITLTSIQKGIDVGTKAAALAAGAGSFDPTPFVGTLANSGVSIAPFYDYESKLPAGTITDLDVLKSSIISGSVKVTSYLSK